jgi:predicted AAA+ superfamily ATPase
MNLNRLIELHDLAKAEGRGLPRKRDLFPRLTQEPGRHFIGILGPRGAGKTILLKQFAAEHADAFYASADTLEAGTDLFEVIRNLSEKLAFKTFLLDEIHFLKDPTALLKQVYDFLKVRVIFTSSVALAMHASAHDLSRRVRLLTLDYFSYREFLRFRTATELPGIELGALLKGEWTLEHLQAGRLFEEYLRGGLLPFALQEPDPLPLLSATVEKVILRDIPTVMRLTVEETEILKKLLQFIGRSSVDGINYTSLSHNLGITRYKAEHYVGSLEKAFVLQTVFPSGTQVLREPKILMTPPIRLLHRDWSEAIGGLREDFFALAMRQAQVPFHYLKSTRGEKTPDYLVEHDGKRYAIEIGGRGKGRQQFKGVKTDQKIILADQPLPAHGRQPLFLLGFLA